MTLSIKGSLLLAFTFLGLAAGCSDGNSADKCCTTDLECAAAGMSGITPCETGACVQYECVRGCNSDSDCDGSPSTPVCMAGVCSCSTSDTCAGSAPICDTASHDCRACTADTECDSGACNIPDGACIDADEILYASPTGAATAACTADAPCALSQASSKLDKDHDYIVLQPGTYHGALGVAHDVTVAGAGSTLDLEGDGLSLSGAKVTLRQLMITSAASVTAGLDCDNCNVTLDHVQVTAAPGATGFHGGPGIQIFDSTFDNWSFAMSSTSAADSSLLVLIDRSTFTAGALVLDGQGDARVANSVFADLGTGNAVQVASTAGKTLTASFVNNTFANASISCDGDGDDHDAASFTANIFFNTTLPTSAATCVYDYSLGSPAISMGKHDLVGDPRFVDAAHHNFQLAAGSPAIDAAALAGSPTDMDHDRVARPQGKGYDIGAYEAKL